LDGKNLMLMLMYVDVLIHHSINQIHRQMDFYLEEF
jgi:hypothetical protein